MASLKDLRNRIGSVKSTQKITRAMQMVAAAKLRKAQEAAEAARPYAERIENVIANLAEARKGDASAPKLMAGTGADQRHLLIVATADRGLCGGFNTNIVRKAREHLAELSRQGKEFQILCVGKKGFDLLKRLYGDKIIDVIDLTLVRKISFENAAEISGRVLEMFADDKFDICTLFYGQFKNVITQIPTAQQIIPVKAPDHATLPDLKGAAYEFEPDEDEILATLLPRFVSVQILRALLENRASEMGAKMTAMDNATRNAGELIDKLTITYNRSRQAQITKELIEIISGAEAL